VEALVWGCIGFGVLYLFDFNKVKKIHPLINSLFSVGVALLVFSTVKIFFNQNIDFTLPVSFKILFIILSFISACIMFYALFGALPFKATYVSGQGNKVIDTGFYALCRHPGVWAFFFTYFFLFLASGKWMMLYATVLWTLMDILHVWVQDRYFFPHTLDGYTDYQKKTPFLLITKESFNRFRTTLLKGE
jgi:protein-S-isoprenylcysteine O-methyltransferase Ste14